MQIIEVEGAPPIQFAMLLTRRMRPFYVPDRLPDLPREQALATVILPQSVDWSPPGLSRPLADWRRRCVAYELVMTEGKPVDIARYIDGALLVEVWDRLVLPSEIRAAWEPVVRAWRARAA